MKSPAAISLGENHQRGITISLGLLDELLCEIEQIARGREIQSVLYGERNHLSAQQRQSLLAEIAQMREILAELKVTFKVKERIEDLGNKIWASGLFFLEVLEETESKYLRRYGPTPPGLKDYLDPKVENLIRHLSNISHIAKGQNAMPETRKGQNPEKDRSG